MQKTRIKRIVSFIIVFSLVINIMSISVNSHNSDIWNGGVPYSVTGVRLGINPSALNSVLTLDVYNSATHSSVGGWASTISPRAFVGSVINLGANPNATRDINVIGVALGGTTYGQIQPRDSWGNIALTIVANGEKNLLNSR